MDKEYVVTLHRKEDLEQFYNEMQLTNFPLVLKRPLSRNTHYMMTEEQAERLRQDPRVWGVEAVDSFHVKTQSVNREPYVISGDFWKNDVAASTINPNLRQWGHLHCAGDQVQRRKGNWGDGSGTEFVNDTVEVFNNGRHVDVVICDDPVSWDNGEWWSSQAGPDDYIIPGYSSGNIEPQGATDSSRFVDYQWFNELNGYVSSIDDDSQTLPTGQITRYNVATNPQYHGNHVTGTVAGRYYGWAKAANIYECQVLGAMQSGQTMPALLLFDYLRAFHRYKPVNPVTGFRNPTITNHSWGYAYNLSETFPTGFALSNIVQVQYRGVNYSASNPGPSGWTLAGIETDFGIGANKTVLPSDYAALRADIEDAIEDGVVVIGAAGNENFYSVPEIDPDTQATHVDWNNLVVINVQGSNIGHY